MTFGTKWSAFIGECSKDTARQIFTEYIQAGGNFIDTASLYQDGESETWLGEFIAEQTLVKREDLVIATKFTGPHPIGHVNLSGMHRKNLVASLERSLKRLRVDYVDILYVHMWDNTVDALDVMLSLDYVVRSGKVLHVAISDAPAWLVAQCQTLANVHALSPFVAYQGRYSACDRDAEAEIFPMLDAFKISYAPWSVLAAGKLASMSREGSARGAGELTPLEAKVQKAIFEVSERIGKPMAQVAISWCATRVTSVMVGARKVEQIRDAIAALSFRLSPEDDAKITEAGKPTFQFPHNVLQTAWPKKSTAAILKSAGRIVDEFDAPVAQPVAKKDKDHKEKEKESK